MAEAAYKGSNWPQRLSNVKHTLFGDDEKPTILGKIGNALGKAKERIIPKKNIVSEFVDNKLDLLKDPHARAGLVAFVSNMGQFIETAFKKAPHGEPTLPLWTATAWVIAGGFYLGHGLLHARDKKRKAQSELAH